MQHQDLDPPAALRDSIASLWYLSKDFSEQQSGFEVVPDGCAEIIFYFGSPCSTLTPAGWHQLSSPFLVGLLNQPFLFRAETRVEIVGIKCFPWAVSELLGLAPTSGSVHVLAHPIAQLQAPLQQCLAAGNVAAALTQLAQYLEQTWSHLATDRVLDQAGWAMRAAGGTLPVHLVAAAAHTTVRTLERKFKRAAGHTVKDVSGLLRFEQAQRHLWQHPRASLAGLAQELSYTDQSHLGREFKRYCGTTPAAFARKALRWQRAFGTDFVAFMLA